MFENVQLVPAWRAEYIPSMWPDNETSRDFLNFSGVADTVAEIIVRARGRPVSIGVSGAWGAGKSSLIRLIRSSLGAKPSVSDKRDFIFVDFNAWLYQGYDDARAALIDVIASALADEAAKRQKGVDKVVALVKRVNWLRAAKLTAGSALAMSLGLPPVGLIGEVWQFGSKLTKGNVTEKEIGEGSTAVEGLAEGVGGLLNAKPEASAPKEIHALRANFEEALEAMGVTLVVLIDDLDRCLPETTISTLEAIRHFLFLRHTAFVIAADNEMIKHAVRRHFDGVDEEMATNYFDKLIQVPIRVPPLGTQEVRAYLMLLFVENSNLDEALKEQIRGKVCAQLTQTWQGKRVDRAFMQTLHKFPENLVGQFDTADRLAPLMTIASGIAGNPRLIKRFLNALAIRMTISTAQGVGVDEAVLAKMLLFERLGNVKAYHELLTEVGGSDQGKPLFLAEWEDRAIANDSDQARRPPWDDDFISEWLRLPPRLAHQDLRGVLYVSREHAPVITLEDRLSSEAAELLDGLLKHPEMSAALKPRLAKVPRIELTIIMDRLLERARQEQEWGVPPIFEACLTVTSLDQGQGGRLAAFLRDRPASQIKPSIVPKIADQPWAKSVFDTWEKADTARNVKTAIKTQVK